MTRQVQYAAIVVQSGACSFAHFKVVNIGGFMFCAHLSNLTKGHEFRERGGMESAPPGVALWSNPLTGDVL